MPFNPTTDSNLSFDQNLEDQIDTDIGGIWLTEAVNQYGGLNAGDIILTATGVNPAGGGGLPVLEYGPVVWQSGQILPPTVTGLDGPRVAIDYANGSTGLIDPAYLPPNLPPDGPRVPPVRPAPGTGPLTATPPVPAAPPGPVVPLEGQPGYVLPEIPNLPPLPTYPRYPVYPGGPLTPTTPIEGPFTPLPGNPYVSPPGVYIPAPGEPPTTLINPTTGEPWVPFIRPGPMWTELPNTTPNLPRGPYNPVLDGPIPASEIPIRTPDYNPLVGLEPGGVSPFPFNNPGEPTQFNIAPYDPLAPRVPGGGGGLGSSTGVSPIPGAPEALGLLALLDSPSTTGGGRPYFPGQGIGQAIDDFLDQILPTQQEFLDTVNELADLLGLPGTHPPPPPSNLQWLNPIHIPSLGSQADEGVPSGSTQWIYSPSTGWVGNNTPQGQALQQGGGIYYNPGVTGGGVSGGTGTYQTGPLNRPPPPPGIPGDPVNPPVIGPGFGGGASLPPAIGTLPPVNLSPTGVGFGNGGGEGGWSY
jgi:hypothetical protein